MRANRLLLALLALAALFLLAVTQLVNLAFSRAPIYQPYSTLRADPLGARALFETLATLPGVKVERHIRRAARLADAQATVFWLGEQPNAPMIWSKQNLATFEAVARKGGRLVIGLLPAGPEYEMTSPSDPAKEAPAKDSPPTQSPSSETAPKQAPAKKAGQPLILAITPEIEKRWRLQVTRAVAKKWSQSDNNARRETSLWFVPLGNEWRCLAEREGRCLAVERTFHQGTIVITADTFPLSNEGLRLARRPQWIAQLVGPWRRVIFDETHLGFEDQGSIGTLIRQFRLEGAALMLVTLAALFIWRNSVSFLPLRQPAPDAALTGDPHRSLTLLLRRAVPPAKLAESCLGEWQRAKALLPYRQSLRLASAAAAARGITRPLQAWQRVRQALQEKS